jgi:hypothetical protein
MKISHFELQEKEEEKMFRLEGFVDDKNVVMIMKALSGRVMDFKMVPVVNAEKKNGKAVAKTSGDPMELLAAYLKQHKLTEVQASHIRDFVTSIGRSPGAYYKYLTDAKEAKLLKRKPGNDKARASYLVNKAVLK